MTAGFRGLDAVSRNVAWVSGSQGTVLRTVDGGRTWSSVGPPGVESLQFRDIHAFDAQTAVILSIGPGTDALALTRTGGRTWREPHNAPAGYRSGVTYHPWSDDVLLAVGPTGSDVSVDGGMRWRQFVDGSFDTVDCTRDGACWASGTKGRVARLSYRFFDQLHA